jgi:hypothetical protein
VWAQGSGIPPPPSPPPSPPPPPPPPPVSRRTRARTHRHTHGHPRTRTDTCACAQTLARAHTHLLSACLTVALLRVCAAPPRCSTVVGAASPAYLSTRPQTDTVVAAEGHTPNWIRSSVAGPHTLREQRRERADSAVLQRRGFRVRMLQHGAALLHMLQHGAACCTCCSTGLRCCTGCNMGWPAATQGSAGHGAAELSRAVLAAGGRHHRCAAS